MGSTKTLFDRLMIHRIHSGIFPKYFSLFFSCTLSLLVELKLKGGNIPYVPYVKHHSSPRDVQFGDLGQTVAVDAI